jgi:hypothetical protein
VANGVELEVRVEKRRFYVSVLAVAGVVALAAGCGTHSSGNANGTPTQTAELTAAQAVKLAAQTARGANSFTGTSTIAIKTSAGNATIAANFSEQLHPSLLAQVDVSSFQLPGVSLPSGTNLSGMQEILTPDALYLKWAFLSTMLHTSKQWIKISLSSLNSSSGMNITSLFNQFSNNGPLTQDTMLAGATNVHTVGTGTVDGVPVTEYTGTVSIDKGLAALDPSTRSSLSKVLSQAGIGTAKFTIWVDGQHLVRKSVVTETGNAMSETITTTITSVNQPVSVQVPADSDVVTPPGGIFG